MSLFLATSNGCLIVGDTTEPHWDDVHQPPSHSGPPPHAPAHGYRAKHHYRYYPDAYVYYDTARHRYFYNDKGGWRMSVSLPGFIRLGSSYVTLELDTDKPYRYYHEHKAKYPPGKMKNKNKNKNKK